MTLEMSACAHAKGKRYHAQDHMVSLREEVNFCPRNTETNKKR